MVYFKQLMQLVIDFMKTPIVIEEYEFSVWGVFIFVCMGLIVMHFLRDFFAG